MVVHIYLQELCKEKDNEVSIFELLDYKIVLVCVYRSAFIHTYF
jgi:hypothetical protein